MKRIISDFNSFRLNYWSNPRNKLVLKGSVYNYGLKILIYGLNIFSIPLVFSILGKERFGIFQTILTFISWAYLANLGIANGLRNSVSKYLALKGYDELRSVIGAAIIISFWISFILLILGNFFLVYTFDPNWLFKGLNIPSDEIRTSFIISFSFFCLNLFTGLFSSIAYGMHKSYLVTTVQLIHLALFCLLLYVLMRLNLGSLLQYVAIIHGLSMFSAQLFPLRAIVRSHHFWPPSLKNIYKYYKSLIVSSLSFFVLQLSTVLLFASDNFIISKFLGANEVAEYSVVNKVFFLIINLFSILLIQIWSSTADALVKKDYRWIRDTIKRLKYALIFIFIFSLIVSLTINDLTMVWIGYDYQFNSLFRFLFSVYVLIHCLNAIYVNVLNGLGRLKIQTYSYIFAALINFFTSYYLIVYWQIGITGVILSKTICLSFVTIICILDYKQFEKSVTL